ncbi:MAG: hypothetical protein GY822_15655, partial [Deltaproteobacteria bacterium]|nr:hypothetical protein [Deltaproteobacteria bacterium]
CDDTPAPNGDVFGVVTNGKTKQWNEADVADIRQDLSGAAIDTHIVYVDDGNKTGEWSKVIVGDLTTGDPTLLELAAVHEDLEAATYSDGWYVLATSLSAIDNENKQRLTRVRIDSTPAITDEESVTLRTEVMAAMQAHDATWYEQWKDEASKEGGLNIEGITRAATDDGRIMYGVRSPKYGANFGNPATNADYSLDDGVAIIATVQDPFGTPEVSLMTIDLGIHAVRGIEWIPAMNTYVVIGGRSFKASDYSLWTWDGTDGGGVAALGLEGFDELCRPESVFQETEGDQDYLVVMSEESGEDCDGAAFTWIKAQVL